MDKVPIQLKLGDIISLKKPHPCGSYQWRVTRLGMDIGLNCMVCGRQVMLPRSEVERRIKKTPDKTADQTPDKTG